MTGTDPEILVIGSINLDLSLFVDRFPDPGETVIGGRLVRGGGGKGANQAVAAARLGRRVALVGRVGEDDIGSGLLDRLAGEGIDTVGVVRSDVEPSGLAVIEVDSAGENRIVVVSGANAEVAPTDLDPLVDRIAAVPVVVAQLEIPVDVVNAAAQLARAGRFVLNPAPAVAGLRLEGIDVLVPNRGELAGLTGSPVPDSMDEIVDQARQLTGGLEAVIVTLGGDGAVVVDGLRTGSTTVTPIAPVPVAVVDTTGAGDAFCAGLADALCLGAGMVDAATWAARVAAVTVTRAGAQASFPARSEVVR